MLEQLFGSRTRVKLLRLFLTGNDQEYYVRELTRRIEERINSVRRELGNLEEMGIIVFEEKDQKKYYRANPNFILYQELRGVMVKSRLIAERSLVKSIEGLGVIRLLVLTGVFTGEKDTRTDMLIVGKVNKEKLEDLIKKFQAQMDHEINYTVMPTKEYLYRQEVTDKFLFDILGGKKIVVIDEMDKEKLTSSERPNRGA
ncbi:MAG: winged helix-turn-helix domain-containing protein [Patescibacteria group bacterium]